MRRAVRRDTLNKIDVKNRQKYIEKMSKIYKKDVKIMLNMTKENVEDDVDTT